MWTSFVISTTLRMVTFKHLFQKCIHVWAVFCSFLCPCTLTVSYRLCIQNIWWNTQVSVFCHFCFIRNFRNTWLILKIIDTATVSTFRFTCLLSVYMAFHTVYITPIMGNATMSSFFLHDATDESSTCLLKKQLRVGFGFFFIKIYI